MPSATQKLMFEISRVTLRQIERQDIYTDVSNFLYHGLCGVLMSQSETGSKQHQLSLRSPWANGHIKVRPGSVQLPQAPHGSFGWRCHVQCLGENPGGEYLSESIRKKDL